MEDLNKIILSYPEGMTLEEYISPMREKYLPFLESALIELERRRLPLDGTMIDWAVRMEKRRQEEKKSMLSSLQQ